jgi:conjugative relaxase-like TrwC/TraI family protein
MTFDGVEGRWKALEMRRICDEADYYDRVAVKRLAENLQKLGLEIVFTKDAFEIVGISRGLIDKFSKRTKTIEEYAARHGITDPVQKAKVSLLTRVQTSK